LQRKLKRWKNFLFKAEENIQLFKPDPISISAPFLREETGTRNIATIDSDYHVYRTKDKRTLKNVLQPYFKTRHH
jgi:hypothetical protein